MRLFIFLLCFCSSSAFAQGLILRYWVNPVFQPVDTSCGAVADALGAYKWSPSMTNATVFSCSTDPVKAGTHILYLWNGHTVRADVVLSVAGIPDAKAPTPAAKMPMFQQAATSYSPASGGGSPTSIDVTVKDAFGTATPEQYQAMLVLFGLFLAGASLIWSVKKVIALFNTNSIE